MRKSDFGVSDQVLHKPDYATIEDGYRLNLLYLGRKPKALISCAVIAHMMCAFVFVYANCRFSHDAAHIINPNFDKSNNTTLLMSARAYTLSNQSLLCQLEESRDSKSAKR